MVKNVKYTAPVVKIFVMQSSACVQVHLDIQGPECLHTEAARVRMYSYQVFNTKQRKKHHTLDDMPLYSK